MMVLAWILATIGAALIIYCIIDEWADADDLFNYQDVGTICHNCNTILK